MQEVTITYKTFKFEELEDKVKEKVIDNHRYINLHDDWFEFCYESFDDRLQDIGLFNKGYWFSLDRDYHIEMRDPRFKSCATFISKALDKHDIKLKGSVFEIVLNEIVLEKVTYVRDGGHKIVLSYIPDSKRCSRLHKLLVRVEEALNEFLKDTLDEFLSDLQKEYEYLSSDEAIRDTIEANDYDFLENGRIFNG
jgi:hypothetical protein